METAHFLFVLDKKTGNVGLEERKAWVFDQCLYDLPSDH